VSYVCSHRHPWESAWSIPSSVGPTGGANVPTAGTVAVVSNLTAVNPTVDGFFTQFPTGTARPLASDVNFVANEGGRQPDARRSQRRRPGFGVQPRGKYRCAGGCLGLLPGATRRLIDRSYCSASPSHGTGAAVRSGSSQTASRWRLLTHHGLGLPAFGVFDGAHGARPGSLGLVLNLTAVEARRASQTGQRDPSVS